MPRSALVAAAMSANTIHACASSGHNSQGNNFGLPASGGQRPGLAGSIWQSWVPILRIAANQPTCCMQASTGCNSRWRAHLPAQAVGAHGHYVDDLAKLAEQRIQQLLQLCRRTVGSSGKEWLHAGARDRSNGQEAEGGGDAGAASAGRRMPPIAGSRLACRVCDLPCRAGCPSVPGRAAPPPPAAHRAS